ncbi:MAG TPA: PA14 domain-containing protein [Chryseosolibacter sp.]
MKTIYCHIAELKLINKWQILSALLLFQTSIVGLAQQEAYESPAGTKFLLYKPPGYSTTTSAFPLLLSLHSKGEVGDDLTELTSKNPEQMPSRLIYLGRWPKDLPFIVLTPQLKPTASEPDPQWPAGYIDEVVRYVTANFRVDMNRIYVTGISRGGTGAWAYAAAYPGKVAALLPMSGRSDPSQACRIKNIPIWAFHGEDDNVAPTKYSIDMINAVRACQPPGIYKPRLNILFARNHNGWSDVYNGTYGYRVFEWLLMFKKNVVSNKIPYVNAGMDLRIALRSGPVHIVGDYFDSDGNTNSIQWKQTGGTALTLSNTQSQFLKITNLRTGSFEFELTVIDDKGARNSDKVLLEIAGASVTPAITKLILINGKTNTEIGNLSEGQIINTTALGISEINLKAIGTDGTASVRFSVNTDQHTRTVNSPGPYLIKGQTTGPEWKIQEGEYLICATPYSETGARGNRGVSQCFKITVTDGIGGGESCAGTGKIKREVWDNVTGYFISNIPFSRQPSSTSELTIFESPVNIGDNYGARVRGYICAPLSGNYTFWISSDDRSELWLSTSEDPADKRKIASVTGWTRSREWTKYASQRSTAITLQGGQKYYIEALHKEASGADNLAVGWQLPDGKQESPIPGKRISPYESRVATSSARTTSPTDTLMASQPIESHAEISLFPNPLQSGDRQLTISGYDGIYENGAAVEIHRMTGEVIHSEKIFCQANCSDYLMNLGNELSRGIYVVNVITNGRRFSKKLVVK